MTQLPDLAEEILEKIFILLNPKDVRNLFVVCKRFSFVVGNSINLMNNFLLQIDCNKVESLTKSPHKKRQKLVDLELLKSSTRKYQNLQILNLKGTSDQINEEIEEVLFHLDKIKYLFICNCQVSSPLLRKLLEQFASTLQTLQIEKTSGFNGTPAPISQKLLHLKEIRILFTNPLVLKQFRDTKIENLMVMCESYLNYYPLIDFLEIQEELKIFNLSSSISIFAISNLQNIKFQLNDLTINFIDLSEIFQKPINSNFEYFFNTQLKSLKRLHLSGGIYSDRILKLILNQMPCLESLHINCFLENSRDYNFEFVLNNHTIKNFVIEFPSISDRELNLLGLLNFMKSLKSLEVIRVNLGELFEANLETLETLKLTECEIQDREFRDDSNTLRNLKQLELRKVPLEITKYLIQKNPGIEKLVIESIVDTETLGMIKTLKLRELAIDFPIPEMNRLFSNQRKILGGVPGDL
jgi:hypothetical protein